MGFTIFWSKKNAFLYYKNNKLKKGKKLGFFQKGLSMVLVKIWQFIHVFLGKCVSE